MKRNNHPLIAITCGFDPHVPVRRECYGEWVARAGGCAVFLRPSGKPGDICAGHDGFLIPGGRDLNPFLYGETVRPGTVLEDQERTEFEFSLLREIIGERKPLLGICYGMQLINVFFGGSLLQEIRSDTAAFIDHGKGCHTVEIRDNPYIPMGERQVNSSHHQAVRSIGAGLKPWAYAADGIVEGLFGEQQEFTFGVQWHPERMNSVLTASIFRSFVDACRKR